MTSSHFKDYMELLQKVIALNKAAQDGQAFETAVKGALGSDPNKAFSMALGNVFGKIKEKMSSNEINWAMGTFIVALRTVNPQFAAKNMHGDHSHGYMQQDAAEAWGELMNRLKSATPYVDQIFSYENEVTMTCDENPDEPATVTKERGLTMMADVNKDTGHVMACLESAMEASVVKKSVTLDRDAQYTKKSALTRCPGYLAINFKRFHYKVKEEASCKIRKDVKFQMSLDLMPIASKELREKIKPQRDAFEAFRDATIAKEVTGYKADEAAAEQEFEPFSFPDDPGSNNSGYYELEAVLTHKGATTSSGHYVAWCKQKDGKWLLFDDDKVSVQKEVDVLGLSGKSADGHIAYILLYGPKRMPKGGAEGVGGGGAAAAAPAAAAGMDVAADP